MKEEKVKEGKKKKPFWKRLLKGIAIFLLAVIVFAGGMLAYLSITEFKPADVETIKIREPSDVVFSGREISILTMNTGYAGLGEKSDFFMDGGKEVRPRSESYVKENMAGILEILKRVDADFYLLQEVDSDSHRSYKTDQVSYYQNELGVTAAYAKNYACNFVPYPLPPIGKVDSGLLTLTGVKTELAERYQLPCPFSWPVSMANLKRALLVSHVPIEGSDKELVIINLHLEAYDDGEGKIKQTNMLVDIMEAEYAKGNYVIVGGDFNQNFPGGPDLYPIKNPDLWVPGTFSDGTLPDGWQFAYDITTPTCRLLNQPLNLADDATQLFVIDGFILSPNIRLGSVETLDESFRYSDHNPVLLNVTLIDE